MQLKLGSEQHLSAHFSYEGHLNWILMVRVRYLEEN